MLDFLIKVTIISYRMSTKSKLLKRLNAEPSDFTWIELVKLLKEFGYTEIKTGKTGGSRRRFINSETRHPIWLHKPHPKNILKK